MAHPLQPPIGPSCQAALSNRFVSGRVSPIKTSPAASRARRTASSLAAVNVVQRADWHAERLPPCRSGKITCQCTRGVSGASRKAEERSEAHVREGSKKVEAADRGLELEIEVRSVLCAANLLQKATVEEG